MNARAFTVAANLVEAGIHLRSGEHASLDPWIAEVAADAQDVQQLRSTLDVLTTCEDVRAAARQMALVYARCAYQLGVYVGLQIRPTSEGLTYEQASRLANRVVSHD